MSFKIEAGGSQWFFSCCWGIFEANSLRGLKIKTKVFFSVLKTRCYIHPHLIVWIF